MNTRYRPSGDTRTYRSSPAPNPGVFSRQHPLQLTACQLVTISATQKWRDEKPQAQRLPALS
jgi:hypothetical protein